MAKLRDPSMPTYVADWLSSQSVSVMTLEQQGAFFRLLCHAWLSGDCTLPDNDAALAALSGLGEKWSDGSGEIIRRCFIKKRVGNQTKLVNKKQASVWKERRSFAERGREGGLKSGVVRRSGTKQTRSKREANGQAKSNSTSTSSFASASTSSRSIIDAALARVRRETLAEPGPLVEWIAESVASGAIDGSKFTRDRVAALAVRCRERGRNGGCALFTTLMRQGNYDHANDDDFSSAVAEIEAHERGPSTNNNEALPSVPVLKSPPAETQSGNIEAIRKAAAGKR